MTKLYEPCTSCDGSGLIRGVNNGGKFVEVHCPCGGTRFVEIGLELSTVDRLVKEELQRRGDPSAGPSASELTTALEESLKLQSHYAELLNMYDGGQRMQFPGVASWIERLKHCRELKKEQAKTWNGTAVETARDG